MRISKLKSVLILSMLISELLCYNQIVHAQITIHSTSDISKNEMIIKGANFGTHPKYGGSDNYLPYLWETFDNANPYITNPKISGGYATLVSNDNKQNSRFCLKHQRITDGNSYTTFRGKSVNLATRYNCKVPVASLSPKSEYFFSGWFMTRNINTLTDNISNQLKTLDASPISNNNKIYFNLEGYAGYPRYNTSIESFDSKPDIPVSESAPDGTWHRFDIFISIPVLQNNYSDIVKFWIDGRLLRVGHQVGSVYSSNSEVNPINAIYQNNWINNSSNSSFYILSDDFFIDFTQARVEISDSSKWDDNSQTHKELQIPVLWTDNSITIKVNKGSFDSLRNKFIFVIDKNGNHSKGFPFFSTPRIKKINL